MDHSSDSPVTASAGSRAGTIDFQRVGFVIGIMLLAMMLFMIPPALTDLVAKNDDFWVFAGSAFVTGFLGIMLVMSARGNMSKDIYLKEGFVLTVASWVSLALVSTIPFLFFQPGENIQGLSVWDAWFEAVSGLTATGATVMTQLDDMPPGILLWRSIIQWIGGIGIILMALVMLPFLKVGGMQLFQAESSDRTDKFVPRSTEMMRLIAIVYVALTVICGIGYALAGMTPFDAVNHAMTTIATGGFSTHDASFGAFENQAIQWLAIVFMFAGSLPLVLYVKFVRTGSFDFWRDNQVRGFTKLVAFSVICLTLWYHFTHDASLIEALRIVSFNSISIISTTGYAYGDYTAWGAGAVGTFFLFMFLGGCTGSTTGGIKTFRLQIMLMTARGYVKKLMSPNRVVVATYNSKKVTPEISASVLAYISVMFAFVMLSTLVLSFFGLDFNDSVSASISALGNVGPALGPNIGPAGTFQGLPWESKIILTFCMLLGRLEYFTVLVLFSRDFWR